MRVRSPGFLVAGAGALVLLTGGAATGLAKSGSSPPAPSASATQVVTRTASDTSCGPAVPLGDSLKAAADYLGVSVEQLQGDLEGGASLAEVAGKQGKSVDGLEQAVVEAAKAELDKSVAAGRITTAEEQQMLGKLRSLIVDIVNRKGDAPGPLSKPPLGDPITAAADYLGLSVDQLAEQLKAGKSLADVAKAQGKSVDALEQAVIDAARSGLDKAVAAGDVTADQEQQALDQVRSQIDAFVNGNGPLSLQIGDGRLSIRVGGPTSDAVPDGPYNTAADYLGLSTDELTKELQAGKSLADVAGEHGKSVDGLKQALVAAATAQIQKAVDALVDQKDLPTPTCDAGVGVVKAAMAGPVLGFGPPGTP
jgi:hypothetical protein